MTNNAYHFIIDIGSRYIKYAYVANNETRKGRVKCETSKDGVKFKRFVSTLNKTHEDLCKAEISTANLQKDVDEYVHFETFGEPVYPEELLARLLVDVKSCVRSELHDDANKIVLVAEKVSPYECSAIMADLEVVARVDAASVVEFSYLPSGRSALVVDLGASALKLYLVNTDKRTRRQEICDDWSSDEFTACLYNYLLENHKIADLERCEEIQVALSKQYSVPLSDNELVDRDEFQGCVRQVVDRLMYRIKQFVRAQMHVGEELTDVVLIGGCGNIPLVKDTLQSYFNINIVQKECEYALVLGLGSSFENKLLQSCLKKWRSS